MGCYCLQLPWPICWPLIDKLQRVVIAGGEDLPALATSSLTIFWQPLQPHEGGWLAGCGGPAFMLDELAHRPNSLPSWPALLMSTRPH